MKIGESMAVLMLASLCASSDTAGARTDDKPLVVHASRTVAPLDRLIDAATRVAKIRLVDRRVQELSDVSCGYVYRAHILEDFKGGKEDFEFVMTAEEDFKGFQVSYLAFVFSHGEIGEDVGRFLDAALTPEERQKINCRLLQDFHTLGGFKTIWSIDPKLSQAYGGEWLELDTRPVVQWFEADAKEYLNSANQKFVEQDGEFFRTVRWQFVRGMIRQAIDGSQCRSNETKGPNRNEYMCPPTG